MIIYNVAVIKKFIKRALQLNKIGKNILNKIPMYRYFKNIKDVHRFFKLTELDRRSIKFYKQFIHPNDLVFDVGANIGDRVKLFLAIDAEVVAFEPQLVCASFLKSVLKKKDSFILVEAALGRREGEAEMQVSDAHVISTLSNEWIESTKESGRFSQYEWNKKQKVNVTTLDRMIDTYGVPSFIKIDVEGYELEVLLGLTHIVDCVSIEFAAENIENIFLCLEHLSSLANMSFQFSEGETMELYLPNWVSEQEIKQVLTSLSEKNKLAWGDVYIKRNFT